MILITWKFQNFTGKLLTFQLMYGIITIPTTNNIIDKKIANPLLILSLFLKNFLKDLNGRTIIPANRKITAASDGPAAMAEITQNIIHTH